GESVVALLIPQTDFVVEIQLVLAIRSGVALKRERALWKLAYVLFQQAPGQDGAGANIHRHQVQRSIPVETLAAGVAGWQRRLRVLISEPVAARREVDVAINAVVLNDRRDQQVVPHRELRVEDLRLIDIRVLAVGQKHRPADRQTGLRALIEQIVEELQELVADLDVLAARRLAWIGVRVRLLVGLVIAIVMIPAPADEGAQRGPAGHQLGVGHAIAARSIRVAAGGACGDAADVGAGHRLAGQTEVENLGNQDGEKVPVGRGITGPARCVTMYACEAATRDDERPLVYIGRLAQFEQARVRGADQVQRKHVVGCARWAPFCSACDWLIENVHLVEITAYSDQDAYTIFETMNDRGLSLAPADNAKGVSPGQDYGPGPAKCGK